MLIADGDKIKRAPWFNKYFNGYNFFLIRSKWNLKEITLQVTPMRRCVCQKHCSPLNAYHENREETLASSLNYNHFTNGNVPSNAKIIYHREMTHWLLNISSWDDTVSQQNIKYIPWLLSLIRLLVSGMNISMSSGTFLTIRVAQRQACRIRKLFSL